MVSAIPHVVVAVIDSDPDVAAMPWAREQAGRHEGWAHSTDPLVISGTALLGALRDDSLFTGFDELWFPTSLPVPRVDERASLVCPRQLSSDVPAALGDFASTGAYRLGVGDGYGLNFIGPDRDLAHALGLLG